MRIPSDVNIPVTAPRSGVLEALALRVGETITGQVVGRNSNGTTLVQIGNQQVSLNLPIDAEIGQVLQFDVKAGGAKPELSLASVQAKPTATIPQTQSLLNAAAVKVETSAPQSTPQANQNPNQNPTQSQNTTTSYTRPLNAPAPATASQSASPQRPTIPIPPDLATSLALKPGQILTARIAPTSANGQQNIVVAGQTIPAPTGPNTLPLPPGTPVQVHVSQLGGQTVLQVQNQKPTPSPYPATSAPAAAASTQGSTQQASTQQVATQQAGTPQTLAPTTSQDAKQGPLGTTSPPAPALSLPQVRAESVARQDSIAKLISTVAGLKSGNAALPQTVSNLADRLATLSLNLDDGAPDSNLLRQAVATSGVLLESNLASGQPLVAQSDLKGLLLLLRSALGNWLGEEPLQRGAEQKPQPPMRGGQPQADNQTQQSLPQGLSGRDAGRQLLSQTDAALSRLRLFQLASLPEAGQRGNPAAQQELNFELPFNLGQHTSLAQFQITRDGAHGGAEAGRGWQLVFAVYFNVIGAVGAKISLKARKTGITIWAENAETVAVLQDTLPELVDSLEALGLELASVRVRHHQPEPEPMPTGEFVDRVS